ncbi:MAG: hypothetical protein GC160_22955 [Acidobacteria bacterium]|nr:hypothetical protein [Acidobacteriota bacterium]
MFYRYLPLLLLIGGAAYAQPVTQTCADGRVIAVSPFNPNPCRVGVPAVREQVEAEASSMPDGFLKAFGPPPINSGNSLMDRVARVEYEQAMEHFAGLVEEPEGFEKMASFYSRWGLGEPVFYKGRYGEYCRFPNAPYRPMQTTMFTATHGAGVAVASWQARLILEGHVLSDLHAFVPPWLQAINSERLQAANQQ